MTGQTWLLPPCGSPERLRIDDLFEADGLPVPDPWLESNDVPFQLFTIARSNLIALLPRSVAWTGVATGMVKALALDPAVQSNPVVAMSREAANPAPAADFLLSHLRRTFNTFQKKTAHALAAS